MKNVTINPNQLGTTQETLIEKLPHRGKKLVDYLMSIYPHFATECKAEQKWKASVVTWDFAIKDLTDEEIRVGCEYCKNSTENFLPAVGRFRHKAKGLPDGDVAFMQARNKDYSNWVISEARRKIPSYDWTHDDEHLLMRKFKAVYGKLCDQILSGEIENYGPPKEKATYFSYDKFLADQEQKYGTTINPMKWPSDSPEFKARLDEKFPIDDSLSDGLREYHYIKRQSLIEINDICINHLTDETPPGGISGEIL